MKKIFFTPGPAQLYPTVEAHIQAALDAQIPSISHRGKQFEGIYRHTDEQLRALLGIPDNFKIFFLSSATECWERLVQNCVGESCFHFVNGSFSKRFWDTAVKWGRVAEKHEVPFGQGFDLSKVTVPEAAELIGAIANETSSGVRMTPAEIASLKQKYPDKLLVVDCVSAFPYLQLDFTQLDAAYFSVQKGFGLPAGLGVLILNERCIEKSDVLAGKKNGSTGAYHSFGELYKKNLSFQTPETPNVLGIYLLGKVAEDMLAYGIDRIRSHTETKAVRLYEMLEAEPGLSAFVTDVAHRSQTVIVGEVDAGSAPLIGAMGKLGFVLGAGYGERKGSQVRIANFPCHSIGTMSALITEIGKFQRGRR